MATDAWLPSLPLALYSKIHLPWNYQTDLKLVSFLLKPFNGSSLHTLTKSPAHPHCTQSPARSNTHPCLWPSSHCSLAHNLWRRNNKLLLNPDMLVTNLQETGSSVPRSGMSSHFSFYQANEYHPLGFSSNGSLSCCLPGKTAGLFL